MTTCRHAALQPAGGGSRSVTGGLRAYMTPQRGENIGDTAGAGMRQCRGPDTGGFQGKAGRGSPMLHTAHIHSPQNWSPPTNGRGRRMSGGVEERIGGSGSRLAAPTKLEQRSSPKTSKGMEEIWWGNELEKGKEAQYELGDALIEQKLEISRPLKDTETQVAKKSGITPKVTPKESSSNPLITDTPLADPDGDDQGYVEIEVVPLETDHKLEEGITSHAFPAELMEGAAKEYIFRTEDIETETEPARSGNEQDFRDIRELIRALPTKTDIQELISTVERSCKQAVEDLREEIVASLIRDGFDGHRGKNKSNPIKEALVRTSSKMAAKALAKQHAASPARSGQADSEEEDETDPIYSGSPTPPQSVMSQPDFLKHMLNKALKATSDQITNRLSREIRELGQRTADMETRVDDIELTIQEHAQEQAALREENATLLSRFEDAENRSRRSNLRLRSIPEVHDDIQSFTMALFQELSPSVPTECLEFDRIH
ncbi:hypothetical protein AB205_0089160, partial [Aquarana catesbeiana]